MDVTLAAIRAFGVRAANLGASGRAAVTGVAILSHLNRVRYRWRSGRVLSFASPRFPHETDERAVGEQLRVSGKDMALLAICDAVASGSIAMRIGGRESHAG